MLKSRICTMSDYETEWYSEVLKDMNMKIRYHRKQWEIASIIKVLKDAGMMQSDKVGLGFACGKEQIPSTIAALGGKAIATDRDPKEDDTWEKANQQSSGKDSLYFPEIVTKDIFEDNISFEFMNMNHIDSEHFGKYDYVWSTCAMEHIGSLLHGIMFFITSLACLKPGGIAIHTTEYNLSSNDTTMDLPGASIYRRKDIEKLFAIIENLGFEPLYDDSMFVRGNHKYDLYVDETYKFKEPDVHLNLRLSKWDATAIRMIVRKPIK